jgi:hypothetical protein
LLWSEEGTKCMSFGFGRPARRATEAQDDNLVGLRVVLSHPFVKKRERMGHPLIVPRGIAEGSPLIVLN